ncbi:MAG: cyclic nucleotide-binding domain-containing protein [Proteobacteria bacterium]|nr:cyclic nucleotide-binding domain-containing protein [Pseudomonadota bacterium]
MTDTVKERPIDFRIFKDLDFPQVTIAAGETILAPGEDGAVMCMVRSGEVQVLVDGMPVEDIGPGGIFGEMSLIEGGPRSARVVAKTVVELVPLDERQFITLVARVPHFSLLVMRAMARRIRRMNQRLSDVA